MPKKIDGILCPARQARQERRTCDQLDERIGLADRLGGVQICRPLGGQTQTNREASKLWNEKADTQTSKQTGTMKDTQAERMVGIFTQHLMTVLLYFAFLSVIRHTLSCTHTHAYRHRHTAKQSSAYPGMPGWVPSGAREKQHAAFECLHTDTHTHRKKKWERALTSVTGSSSGKSTSATLDQISHMLLWCDCSLSVSQQHQSSTSKNQGENAFSRLQWT